MIQTIGNIPSNSTPILISSNTLSHSLPHLSTHRYTAPDVLDNLAESTFQDQYLAALYITVVTISTMGYGDIVPVNNMERIINIFILCFGATAFSFVVAHISDLIQNFNQVETHNASRITEIKEFLAETRISSSLFKDIVNHFKTAMKHSSIFDEELILSRLPCRIRDELLLYIHRQSLTSIPLFRYITNDNVKLYLFKQMKFQVMNEG